MQRQITHTSSELPRCTCGRSPRHFIDQRAAHANGGHFLECSSCDRRTARCPDLNHAITDWRRITGQSQPVPTTTPHLRLTRVR